MLRGSPSKRLRRWCVDLQTAMWCNHCVRGKGKENAQGGVDADEKADMNLVELDYGHARTEALADEMQPVLATHHNHSSAGIALICQHKGPQDLDVIKEVEQWLAQLGLMGLIRLRTDEEPSVTSVAKQLAARRAGRTILELAPLNLHQALEAWK